jgi:hypothetical protein
LQPFGLSLCSSFVSAHRHRVLISATLFLLTACPAPRSLLLNDGDILPPDYASVSTDEETENAAAWVGAEQQPLPPTPFVDVADRSAAARAAAAAGASPRRVTRFPLLLF